MNGTGVDPFATVPSELVRLTDRVKVVFRGAVGLAVMLALNPSVEATTGAFTGSEDIQVGTVPTGSVMVFPAASWGVASNVADVPGTIPLTGC